MQDMVKADSNRPVIRSYYSELVRACLEKRDPAPIPEGISFDVLVDYAIKGQMPYPVLTSLLRLDLKEEYKEEARKIVKSSVFKTLIQVAAYHEITKALEEGKVRHQVLKGTILKMDYPSPEMREMSDIDLVVFDETLERATEVMEKLGYKNCGVVKHHAIFTKKPGIMVEVHWCLFDENVDHKQFMYFKNFRSNLKEGFKYTYEFSKEDFYIYMLAHMAKHFFETGCGIRNLIDIYIFNNKYGSVLDKKYISGELTACGLLDFEKHMKELTYIWLEDKKCSDFYEDLFEYMLVGGIYGKTENGIWSQLAKETVDGNKMIKLHYYFPSINFMKEKYPWLAKAPFLLPVAWIIRGVTGVSQKQSRDHRIQLESSDKERINRMLNIYHRLNLNFRK